MSKSTQRWLYCWLSNTIFIFLSVHSRKKGSSCVKGNCKKSKSHLSASFCLFSSEIGSALATSSSLAGWWLNDSLVTLFQSHGHSSVYWPCSIPRQGTCWAFFAMPSMRSMILLGPDGSSLIIRPNVYLPCLNRDCPTGWVMSLSSSRWAGNPVHTVICHFMRHILLPGCQRVLPPRFITLITTPQQLSLNTFPFSPKVGLFLMRLLSRHRLSRWISLPPLVNRQGFPVIQNQRWLSRIPGRRLAVWQRYLYQSTTSYCLYVTWGFLVIQCW